MTVSTSGDEHRGPAEELPEMVKVVVENLRTMRGTIAVLVVGAIVACVAMVSAASVASSPAP